MFPSMFSDPALWDECDVTLVAMPYFLFPHAIRWVQQENTKTENAELQMISLVHGYNIQYFQLTLIITKCPKHLSDAGKHRLKIHHNKSTDFSVFFDRSSTDHRSLVIQFLARFQKLLDYQNIGNVVIYRFVSVILFTELIKKIHAKYRR